MPLLVEVDASHVFAGVDTSTFVVSALVLGGGIDICGSYENSWGGGEGMLRSMPLFSKSWLNKASSYIDCGERLKPSLLKT